MKRVSIAAALLLAAACGDGGGSPGGAPRAPAVRTLVLGAYTTPREVYGREIIPAFQRHWKAKTGQEVKFQESYLGSGAQSRAVIGGFEADVVALSLEPDVQKIADAGLITRDWKTGPAGGMVSRSVVVLGVRPGNPKAIRDWDDLRRDGVQVLTPSPRTSGGAMWNIAALYGAVSRRRAGGGAQPEAVLRDVLGHVSIMDKGARESMLTFEGGVGDVAITYENEVLVARQAGKAMDYVIPSSTILIENPVAIVDEYVEKHGTRDVAEAFVAFLQTPEVQRMYARYGLRAIDQNVARETAAQYPAVPDLFTIADLGGWPAVTKSIFDKGALFDRASAGVRSAQ
ncbi:MAG TPA: sulfate ABC transporter substrate-binding protein [Longimicrobium sp.]|jgi:sulfate transport system substrate-binding protein|uniref:sulfate ABC transporter substrate-binding protein n=1 Tax=Longimicrobium sp. TaxID=2029185 RepID=UPI002ED85801